MTSLMNEIWKDVDSYKGYYQVSNCGRVRSVSRSIRYHTYEKMADSQVIKPVMTYSGYGRVTLNKNGNAKIKAVHRLVLFAFTGPPPTHKHQCNHKDGDKMNNHIDNLEWVTGKENVQHSFNVLNNRTARGERQGHSKLTEDDVIQIRRLYATGEYTQQEIADMYGVRGSNIGAIVRLESWAHVEHPDE